MSTTMPWEREDVGVVDSEFWDAVPPVTEDMRYPSAWEVVPPTEMERWETRRQHAYRTLRARGVTASIPL